MKRFLICMTLLLLLGATWASGQTIDVVSIEEATTDLQARTNPRVDLNGDLCALVKVELPSIDDLELSGNIVGTVVYRNGVYNIYVSAGTKRLNFTHNDYYPGEIDFESAGIAVTGGTTYRVKLQRSEAVDVRQPAVVTQQPVPIPPIEEAVEEEPAQEVASEPEEPVEQKTAPQPEAPEPVKAPRPKAEPMGAALAVAGFAPGSGEISFGAMGAYAPGNIGGYAKFRSSFNDRSASHEVTSDGMVDGQGLIWASGQAARSRTVFTAGVLVRAASAVYPYAGIGYGSRSVYWESADGQWAKVFDYSLSGLAAEAGVLLRLGPVAVSLSVGCTAFKYSDAEVGIGVTF